MPAMPPSSDTAEATAVSLRPIRRAHINSLFWPRQPTELFDSGEHAIIPLTLPFKNGPQDARTYQMRYMNGLSLTYGQILALAGDFYADPAHPISNQSTPAARINQVQSNVNSLIVAPAAATLVPRILAVMQKEIDAMAPMAWRGLPPHSVYSTQWFDYQYNGLTGGSYMTFMSPGTYLLIAATNWDHFGPDAISSYIAAHSLAINIAMTATNDETLCWAYAANAFADHYLTDLFSAGHVRTPRRQMYARQFPNGTQNPVPDDYNSTTSGMSGVVAKAMHDEDSVNGLWVGNANGDYWLAFGDGRYRDSANYANAALVQQAVSLSIADVWWAYTAALNPDPSTFSALKIVPNNWSTSVNYSPMLVATSNDVLIRTNLDNLTDYSHTTFNLVSAYYDVPDTPLQGEALLPLETPVIKSVTITGGVDQLGPMGVPALSPPPMSFSVGSTGAVTVAWLLPGPKIANVQRAASASSWTLIDTLADDDIASAPSVPPTPQSNAQFFFISGNDLDDSGTMVAGTLQRAYLENGLTTTYLDFDSEGGSLISAPVAASVNASELAVFAFGGSDQKTLECWRRTSNSSSWMSMATTFTPAGIPTVITMSQGDYRILVPDTDGFMWYRTLAASWLRLAQPGPVRMNSLIGAASWSSTRLDCFARNANGTLSHVWLDSSNWTDGEILPNVTLLSSPCVVSPGPNRLMVFYAGADRKVHLYEYNAASSPVWIDRSLNQPALSAPVAVATPSLHRVDVMVIGTDNKLHHASYVDGQSWSSWEIVNVPSS